MHCSSKGIVVFIGVGVVNDLYTCIAMSLAVEAKIISIALAVKALIVDF
jgi:hypothetical protein